MRPEDFSPREQDILLLIGARHLTGTQAARQLNISPNTLYGYTKSIARRLPNDGTPQQKIRRYVADLDDEQRAALG